MSVNIRLGNEVISGVGYVNFEDADNSGTWDKFALYEKPIDPDVLFYDYDGTILYSYSKAEFLALTEMPANPTHEGLVAQGWNWSLSDAQDYVSDVGVLDIGQNYTTSDGETKLYVTIDVYSQNLTLRLRSLSYGSGNITISWGDGETTTATCSTNGQDYTHSYAAVGDYIISILVPDGMTVQLGQDTSSSPQSIFGYNGESAYSQSLKKRLLKCCLTKVLCGNNISVSNGAFAQCMNLKTVVLSLNSFSNLGSAFTGTQFENTGVSCIIIPADAVSNYKLSAKYDTELTLVCLPHKDISSVPCFFPKIQRVCIPTGAIGGFDSVNGSYYIPYLQSKTKIYMLSKLTSINTSLYQYNTEITEFISDNTLTTLSSNCFSNSPNLTKVDLSGSAITTLSSNVFAGCLQLSDVTLNDSITTIQSNAFAYTSIKTLHFPATVSSIQATAFANCELAEVYDFSNHQSIPTLSSSNAFNNNNDTYQIRVPNALLDQWKAATNWSAVATHIVGV